MLLQFDTTKYSSALGEQFTPYGLGLFALLFGFFIWYNFIKKDKKDNKQVGNVPKANDENSPKDLPKE